MSLIENDVFGENYTALICGDITTTVRLARMHSQYVSIDALVEALVDGFGDETPLLADKMKELYERQKSEGKGDLVQG